MLLFRRQDHRHGLWVDRLDDSVRRRRQHTVDKMRPWDRLRLGAAVASEFRPDADEREQRPVIIEREPDDILLFRLGVQLGRVFRKAVGWNQAAVLRFQPGAPVWRRGVADVGDL